VPSKENPSGIGSSKAFATPTEQTNDMPAAISSPSAASTQAQPPPCVSEEIPKGPLLSRPVLELVSLVDVHDDVFSEDVDHANSESWEELEIPRIQDAPVTHSPSDVLNDEHSLTVDLEAFASDREMSPTQHFEAHVDVQTCPQADPLIVRSIPDDTATFLEMERLAQSMADTTGTDENGDNILTVYESHTNPNVQHDLDL